jgi:hypothetical protein
MNQEYLSDVELRDLHLRWSANTDERCFIGTSLIEELLELRAVTREYGLEEVDEEDVDMLGMTIIQPDEWDDL